MVIPAGFRYHFGSFYVQPEFGIGLSTRHTTTRRDFIFTENFISIQETSFESDPSIFNSITYPVFLSFGSEIDAGPVKILLGVKGYYSVNNMSEIITLAQNYYGVGIVTGVRF